MTSSPSEDTAKGYSPGVVYVQPGGASGTLNLGDTALRIEGHDDFGGFGDELDLAPDVDGDGTPELVDRSWDSGGGYMGEAYVFGTGTMF